MKKLIEGIHNFQETEFRTKQQLFKNLAEGQKPLALFITCSDSQVIPNLLTQTDPGELFILKNAGNIVPPYGAVKGGEAGTIEYAIKALQIKDIIICGHSHCGTMEGLLHPDKLVEMPAVQEWLTHAKASQLIVADNYDHLTDETDRLTAIIEENVLVQLENLRTYPCVSAALRRGEVKLHGWVYQFETGEVFEYYDPVLEQFSPIEKRKFLSFGEEQ